MDLAYGGWIRGWKLIIKDNLGSSVQCSEWKTVLLCDRRRLLQQVLVKRQVEVLLGVAKYVC